MVLPSMIEKVVEIKMVLSPASTSKCGSYSFFQR